MTDFDSALSFVLAREGGYVDDPDDRGGATNRGITQYTYDNWLVLQGMPSRAVIDMTPGECAAIYRYEYWTPAQCDKLAWPLNLATFDAAVQHGLTRAAKLLQHAVGAEADGVIGPATLAAAGAMHPTRAALFLVDFRRDYYHAIVAKNPSQQKFLAGWLNRSALLDDLIVKG